MFSTGKLAIGFDLMNQTELFRIESEGNSTALVLKKPLTFLNNKVYFNDKEISTYEDKDGL